MTRQILNVLKLSGEHRLTETVLLTEVRVQYGHCGETEFKAGLKNLERQGLALPEEDPITGDIRWGLTAKGRGHE